MSFRRAPLHCRRQTTAAVAAALLAASVLTAACAMFTPAPLSTGEAAWCRDHAAAVNRVALDKGIDPEDEFPEWVGGGTEPTTATFSDVCRGAVARYAGATPIPVPQQPGVGELQTIGLVVFNDSGSSFIVAEDPTEPWGIPANLDGGSMQPIAPGEGLMLPDRQLRRPWSISLYADNTSRDPIAHVTDSAGAGPDPFFANVVVEEDGSGGRVRVERLSSWPPPIETAPDGS